MSEPRDVRQMLELAEQAAINGDFSSADELLSSVARIQETELGPLHPELANTLNSLAIVAERTGRIADAETFYWRSATIASASLPADHPIVIESRKNLEDFCRERGLPTTAAAGPTSSVQDTTVGLDAFATEAQSGKAQAPTRARTVDPGVSKQIEPPSSGKPSPPTGKTAATAPLSLPPAPRRSSRQLAWMPVAAIVLVAVAVLMRQPSPSQNDSTATAISQATKPAPPPPLLPPSPPAPTEQTPPPVMSRDNDRSTDTDQPEASAPSSGAISLTAGQLCETFSTSREGWQCDPPGDPVARGPIVFYTRVRSPRDSEVVHRWYHEDMLRQTVRLRVRANASEGYRTYSRHTVDGVGDWRVEARSADGDLLHEQRFAVR